MAEESRFWNGTTIGDAIQSPYDATTEFSDVMKAVAYLYSLSDQGGVLYNVDHSLIPTLGSGVVNIDTGKAIVDGSWYRNTVLLAIAIPTPAVSTRIDRIVLRKNSTAQTIRLTRLVGVEGGSEPALTQIVGSPWDIPICSVTIDIAGVMTLNDERVGIPRSRIAIDTFVPGIATATHVITIPPGYSHIELLGNLKVDGSINNDVDIQFNGDTGANYSYSIDGYVTNSSTETISYQSGKTFGEIAQAAGVVGANTVSEIRTFIANYRSIYYKTVISKYFSPLQPISPSEMIGDMFTQWLSIMPITSITLSIGKGSTTAANFVPGTNLTTYLLP